jgi:hypothetical protein
MSHRLEIGLALLLATAIAVAIWAAQRSPKPPTFDPRASTFLSGPQGSKGLHEVLIRLKQPSERRRVALFNLATDRRHRPAILAVLNPPISLQDAELEQVVQYVRSGGAVVAAGSAGGITRCAGWRLVPDSFRSDSVAVRSPQPGLRLPRAARTLAPRKADDLRRERLEDLRKGGGEDEAGCRTLVPIGVDTLVAVRDGRPLIVRLHYRGGGTISLAADAGWFRNRLWRDTDVPLVVVPLLTPERGRGGRVAWDEYHQGFGQQGGGSLAGRTWSWLRESPAGWAILQLIAVALVWLAVTAVRFGPARSVIERRRRSPLEHLEALAAGLEGGAATGTAVQRLVAGLGRRLGSGRARNDLDSLDLAMRGARGHAAVRRLKALLTERDESSERVLATAQAVEDVWEELRPRQTRDAF